MQDENYGNRWPYAIVCSSVPGVDRLEQYMNTVRKKKYLKGLFPSRSCGCGGSGAPSIHAEQRALSYYINKHCKKDVRKGFTIVTIRMVINKDGVSEPANCLPCAKCTHHTIPSILKKNGVCLSKVTIVSTVPGGFKVIPFIELQKGQTFPSSGSCGYHHKDF